MGGNIFGRIRKLQILAILMSAMLTSMAAPFTVLADVTVPKQIKVGFFQFDGYHDIDEYGGKSGYGYDFIQMIARYDNDEYEFVGYDKGWSEMITMLDKGEIDLLTNVAKTQEREENYLFSDRTMGEDSSLFTVRDDNATIVAGDYATYDGVVVGSIAGSIQIQEFEQFAKEKGFTYLIKTYGTEKEVAQALADGEVEGIVSIGLRSLQNEKVIDQINKSDMYVMVRKGDTELMDQINRAINRMDQESANWRSELFDKYYHADQGNNISFQAEEIDYINHLKEENTVLKVAVNPDRKPYSYYQGDKIQGIIPRIFEEVAARVGIEYEIQEVKTREEYQKLLATGEIDICLDEIFSFSEAAENGFKLSDPYLTTSLARIINKDFDGKVEKVAVLKQADIKRADAERLFQNIETVVCDSMQECITAVEEGKADATYVYAYAAQIALNLDPQNDIRMNIMMDYGNQFAIGVPEDRDYRLLTVLNKGINSIEKEYTQNIIMDETDYQVDEVPFSSYLSQHPWMLAAIVLLVLVLVGLAVLLFLRLSYINKLKLEEEKKNKLLQEKAEQEAEFVQAMTYVCRTNEMVRNTNLIDRTNTDYYLEDGQLHTKTVPYVGFDLGNHNLIFYPEDYEQVVKRFDEKKVVYLSQHGGGEEYFECRSKNKDGEYRWYGYTMQAVPADAVHPCNYIVYKKDIHEAKLEDIKARQNLEDALKMAQKASEAKGQFMSRMSHEIRTPLNAVLGYLNMAEHEPENPEKIMHCIQNSEIAANHLLSIINNVLDISAIESGKIKIARVDFNLRELLHALQTVFENQALSKKIQFQMDMKGISIEWVNGDSLRLNQVLMNLLSNAMKFTDENGHVTLEAKEIRHTEGRALFQFRVSDDGIGMSEEYQQRMYQSFEQESAGTAVKYGGSGLGLSITKNLVNMMNGSINVDSKEGEGTTFTVVLELGITGRKEIQKNQEAYFTKQRVLVVEDDKDCRDALKKILKNYGLKSEFVDTQEQAIRKIEMRQTTDYTYALCLVDCQSKGYQKDKRSGADTPPVESYSRPLDQSVLFNILNRHLQKREAGQRDANKAVHLAGVHILLAEDNDMNIEIATDILTKAGMIVHGVRNGQEAVDAFLQSRPGTYQAILMDIQMPVMDGYEAARRIRKGGHEESRTIPIIAMTANAFSEDVSAAISAGMNDHISKPVNFDKLYASLENYMK